MAVAGCAMVYAVSRQPLAVEAQASPHGVCHGQSGAGAGFSQSISVFSYQHHSTIST
jgi:hypothetical protein